MSKPIYKITHGSIGEAMCCYTDGSYKDADIALTEYENSIRADERAKTIAEVYERYNGDLGSFGFWLYEQIEEVRNE